LDSNAVVDAMVGLCIHKKMKRFLRDIRISKVLMQQLRNIERKALEHHPDKILEQIGRRKVQGSR
jgi:hypothetical protein